MLKAFLPCIYFNFNCPNPNIHYEILIGVGQKKVWFSAGDCVNRTNKANMKIAHMIQEKGLDAHADKPGFIVFDGIEYKRKLDKQMVLNLPGWVRASMEATSRDRQ